MSLEASSEGFETFAPATQSSAVADVLSGVVQESDGFESPRDEDLSDEAEEDPLKDVPDDIREAARLAPDHWISPVDPQWEGEGPPPPWAMIGQWRSGSDGEIEEWADNPLYRPSPRALGMPEPRDPIDNLVQLAVAGWGSGQDVMDALASATVAVLMDTDGRLWTAFTPDGSPVVPVLTTVDDAPTTLFLTWKNLPVRELVEQLPDGHRIYLNPAGPISMIVETESLKETIAAADAEEPSTEAVVGRPVTEAEAPAGLVETPGPETSAAAPTIMDVPVNAELL
ncbi:type VII secretion system-associated protein (plasmid) [Streptomyces sp. AHU1]|uniref:type VII secretion system-associated protein n=1 Tax=Streptomyces sp. AHU1 TaxID=3377215 RepID=UPI0038780EC0